MYYKIMRYFDYLSPSAQAAFSELRDIVSAREMSRTTSSLSGSFHTKNVNGKDYWYYQFRDLNGKPKHLYIGVDSDRVRKLIERSKEKQEWNIIPHLRASVSLGCEALPREQFRVIKKLSDYGFFKAGGILAGTHAFVAAGNALGVRWTDGGKTQDIDFAHAGRRFSIALPSNIKVDIHDAIESLEMGFLPIKSFDGKLEASYINPKQPDFRIDFLTARIRNNDTPIVMPGLNVALQPLKFMEFSLESPDQTVILSDSDAVAVNFPSPARMALHKLLVWGERKDRVKAEKDLRQARAMIAFFKDNRPFEIAEAKDDLMSRGKGWATRLNNAMKVLEKKDPALGAFLREN
ncbi:MAG: nucleotidyltransferase domain-containing protein [Gallionella sp.]|nr:nucleotidyltransferase domain-containing protein [Gallionella sp.]